MGDLSSENEMIRQEKDRAYKLAFSYFKSMGLNPKRYGKPSGPYEMHKSRFIEVNGFIYSPYTGKWRNKKKAKWYRSKGKEDFYRRLF